MPRAWRSGRGPQRSAAKERFWRGHVARQAAGRLSVREYCDRHALAEPSFYAWRRELSRRAEVQPQSGVAGGSTAPPVPCEEPQPPQFVQLDIRPAMGLGLIEIVLGHEGLRGSVVRVPPGTDRATLESVLTALAAALRESEGRSC